MKRIFAFILVLAMLAGVSAFAEDTGVEVFGGAELEAGYVLECDLDSDGTVEEIVWNSIEDEDNYTELVILEIKGASSWSMPLYGAKVYVCDMDSDGSWEIFVTGDEMSCDYVTYCMHFYGGRMVTALFADANRGDNMGGYFSWGYGIIERIGEGTITLCGSQDVLGTYFGSRVFALQDGVFELVDDGMWRFDWDIENPDVWEYSALNPIVEIPVNFMDDGDEYEGVLAPGEKIIITASDKVSIVYFRTEDGRTGWFWIEPAVDGWGTMVNGMHENEVFEYIPYAD